MTAGLLLRTLRRWWQQRQYCRTAAAVPSATWKSYRLQLTGSEPEVCREQAAHEAVFECFPPSARFVGIGSDEAVTAHLVSAILALPPSFNASETTFVPTGPLPLRLLSAAGLRVGSLEAAPQLDVAFDGADHIDAFRSLIRGGGESPMHEKLVAMRAKKFVIVSDKAKAASSLGVGYKRGIPIEVYPPAASYVVGRLRLLGSNDPTIRLLPDNQEHQDGKEPYFVTQNGNLVIDAPFLDGFNGPAWPKPPPLVRRGKKAIQRWNREVKAADMRGKGIGNTKPKVDNLAELLNSIVGVVGHGLFSRVDRIADLIYLAERNGNVIVRGRPQR